MEVEISELKSTIRAVDGDSLFFHSCNRNKKSVTIDITRPDEVARLKTLVVDADIVIQNLRPGVVEKFGIAPDDLIAVNPRLIYCSIWAFGYQGPLRLALLHRRAPAVGRAGSLALGSAHWPAPCQRRVAPSDRPSGRLRLARG